MLLSVSVFSSQTEWASVAPGTRTVAAGNFAQSSFNTLVADLQQEIAQGSTATTVGNTPNSSTLYQPLAPADMLPARSGNPEATGSPAADPIPNLIRRSVRADAIAAPGVPSLASAVNSAADPALNGGVVNPARWNLHYLVPRFDADGSTGAAASTPDAAANFTAPDWVLVTANGPKVLTAPDATVVGRYAFAMYDEGGLLDVNAAGYPTPTTPAAPTGFTATQVGYKGLLSLADLTQLPVVKTPATSSDYLAQSSVDRLVGWRNYASAQPAGAFPNYAFDSSASARYYSAVRANRTGFLSVNPAVQFNGQTDQLFTSRQQLIGLCDAFGISRNALQYLTTYSRALEQSSFVPAHVANPATAPSINAVSPSVPPPATAADSYLGNNDAAGSSGSTSGQDVINPALLTARVMQAFTRSDGTTAVVGEPLIKRKFALSRLAEVSYYATDTTPSITDPTISNGNHIHDWFGLSRSNASSPWTYNHGATHIMTLGEVSAAGREPDFAELLKASINAGSLAKGGPNLHNTQNNYQYGLDTSVDCQVLQIMANLIDQSDTDSFPTVIQIALANGYHTVRGVEDLPYFYRYHQLSVVTRKPNPLLSRSNQVVWKNSSTGTTVTTTYDCEPLPSGGLTDPGSAVFLYVPEVWNPHDLTPLFAGQSGARPARYRMVAVTDDPAGATPPWQTGESPQANGTYYSDIPPAASVPAAYGVRTESSTAFTFGDGGGQLFREPSLLYRSDAPTNVNIAPDTGSLAGPYVDANTGIQYFGIQVGQSPVSYVGTVNQYVATPASSNSQYLFQASSLAPIQLVPAGGYPQYTFRLQYQDPTGSGAWITYDEKYFDFHGLYRPNLVVNPVDYPNDQWKNVYSSGQLSDVGMAACDPRTARFGGETVDNLTSDGAPFLEPAAAATYTGGSTASNDAFAASRPTVFVTQRPGADRGNAPNYDLPGMTSDPGKNMQMRWFSGGGYSASNGQSTSPLFYDGLLSENNPAIYILARDGSTAAHLYYEDADGLARRAMGAYAVTVLPSSYSPVNLQGLPHATANTYPSGSYGVGGPIAQSQSRPLLLNRPFHSVAEMSYAFTGTPWKQLDFFTPESGDTALLDAFCLTEPPPTALVAGKVNLNTRQAPVLQAVLAGAYRDEINNLPGPAPYALPALNSQEASAAAAKLVGLTTDTADAWRGPLANVAELVGRFIPNPGNTKGATDLYQFTEPLTGQTYTYAGLSAALDNSVYTANGSIPANYRIQRMREAAVRPLADCGQTRVWNILIDLVAQSGSYPANAVTLADFAVTEENHYWMHVAIDRVTGQVLDQNIEQVYEGVTGLGLSAASVPESQPAGTVVGTLLPVDANGADTIVYSIVAGSGGDDNASFTVSGNTLYTAATFQYLTKSSYNVRLRAANAYGQGYEKAFIIAVRANPYTAWKAANFGASASDPTVAGDAADPDHDGLSNLLEYALGTSPTAANASGITASASGGTLTMNYTRASAATDVTVQALWSSDLTASGAWTHAGVTETMLSDDGKTQHWQAVVQAQGSLPAFLRLQVTHP